MHKSHIAEHIWTGLHTVYSQCKCLLVSLVLMVSFLRQKSVYFKLHEFFVVLISLQRAVIPGPPFLVGACIVLLAFLVAVFIPEHSKVSSNRKHSNSISSALSNNLDRSSEEDIEPLLQDSSVWRLTSEETMEQINALNCRLASLVGCVWTSKRNVAMCKGRPHYYGTSGWYHTCQRACLVYEVTAMCDCIQCDCKCYVKSLYWAKMWIFFKDWIFSSQSHMQNDQTWGRTVSAITAEVVLHFFCLLSARMAHLVLMVWEGLIYIFLISEILSVRKGLYFSKTFSNIF